jgi:hypothetical protein
MIVLPDAVILNRWTSGRFSTSAKRNSRVVTIYLSSQQDALVYIRYFDRNGRRPGIRESFYPYRLPAWPCHQWPCCQRRFRGTISWPSWPFILLPFPHGARQSLPSRHEDTFRWRTLYVVRVSHRGKYRIVWDGILKYTSNRVEVPGGEECYVALDGEIKYTGPHSAAMPPGSIVGGFTTRNITVFTGRLREETLMNWKDPNTRHGECHSIETVWDRAKCCGGFRGYLCMSKCPIISQRYVSDICQDSGLWSEGLH